MIELLNSMKKWTMSLIEEMEKLQFYMLKSYKNKISQMSSEI